MLFVVAVGLGPFAGVLALWVHTTGILAKLFSEAVEAIDPQPVEGIRATGANALEEIVYGVIPQVLPLWISYSLYRFESNVRSASVVGMVGAGGIGVVLWEIIRGFQYARNLRGDDHHRRQRERHRPDLGAHPQGTGLGSSSWPWHRPDRHALPHRGRRALWHGGRQPGTARAAMRAAGRAGRQHAGDWSPRRCCTTWATCCAARAAARRRRQERPARVRGDPVPARRCSADAVLEPIRMHVDAKRYLCATVDRLLGDAVAGVQAQPGIAGRAVRPGRSAALHRAALRHRRRGPAPLG